MIKTSKNIVLASASPRRREILSKYVNVCVIPSTFPETLPKNDADEYVLQTAMAKANQVFTSNPDSIVIGADTIIVFNGEIIEKPRDKVEAVEILSRLVGNSHQVKTAIVLIYRNEKVIVDTHIETTTVNFGIASREMLEWYVETGEPMDKAGGYGIQGLGACLIESIQGCYYNVVGLPIYKVIKMLQKIGQ